MVVGLGWAALSLTTPAMAQEAPPPVVIRRVVPRAPRLVEGLRASGITVGITLISGWTGTTVGTGFCMAVRCNGTLPMVGALGGIVLGVPLGAGVAADIHDRPVLPVVLGTLGGQVLTGGALLLGASRGHDLSPLGLGAAVLAPPIFAGLLVAAIPPRSPSERRARVSVLPALGRRGAGFTVSVSRF